MRLGSDALKLPGSETLSTPDQVDDAAKHGLDGLFFRTMLHMSPTLDRGLLREVRQRTDAHGMYLESGLGKINPYGLPEAPEIRAAGDGDTLLGFRRMMEAAAEIGISELWVATANFKPYGGRFGYDRFRTDVSWSDQLEAAEKFAQRLAPIARDLGLHLNIETHEEITSFEIVRLIESVGTDVMGVTYDTANPLQRAEHPALTAQRLAPYVRQTHIKDAGLVFDPDGIRFQMRPNGQGVVDLHWVLPALYRANPGLNLSLEIAEPRTGPPLISTARKPGIALYDPEWVAGHPDLTADELARYLSLVQRFTADVTSGRVADPVSYEARDYGVDEAWTWVEQSLSYVRSVLDDAGIPLTAHRTGTAAGEGAGA
jgi:sugar phosphate isomerase/epimerase